MEPHRKQNKGNALLGIMIVGVITAITLQATLSMSVFYSKDRAKSKNKAASLAVHSFDLSLFSELFRFKDGKPPTLYFDPIPNGQNFDKSPIVRVVFPKANGTRSIARTDGENFEVSQNKMVSIMIPSGTRDVQYGYIASGKISQLSSFDLSHLISNPSSQWPRINEGGLQSTQVRFVKAIPYKSQIDAGTNNLLVPEKILLQVQSTDPNIVLPQTFAEINVEAPPVPECKLSRPFGQGTRVLAGGRMRVKAEFKGVYSALNIEDKAVDVPSEQHIRSMENFNEISDIITLKVPENPLPGDVFNSGKRWKIKAQIFAINPNQQLKGDCELPEDIVVLELPPPVLRPPLPPNKCLDIASSDPYSPRSNDPFELKDAVNSAMRTRGLSASRPLYALRRSTGASGGGNDWDNQGSVEKDAVNAVCNALGYMTYVSSTCEDRERSGRYPNGKCLYHSPGDDFLSYFSGNSFQTQDLNGSDKYRYTWIATITCKDKLEMFDCP